MEQELFDKLNTQQYRAATYGSTRQGVVESGPILIIAGAGTGKTMTLAHRTAFLLINGVAAERILMLTFSRRAAREMAGRAVNVAAEELSSKRGGTVPVKLDWAGTFHSIGSRLLRLHAGSIGLDPGFTIIDQSDSADLIDLLRHEFGLSRESRRFPKKSTCFDIYSQCVNRQSGLQEVLETFYPWCIEWKDKLALLFRAYIKAKQHQNLLDYDDLLLHWMWLCENQKLASAVSSRFDHILVDEYQDTNVLQARILNLIRPTGKGMTVVGDDAQSIYGFRAAEVENILQFPDNFTPAAQVIPLEENYRSCQPILDVSNALLAESPRAYQKKLYSARKDGCVPTLVSVESDQEQANYIVERILDDRESGTDLRDQAVLFRNGHHSDRLEVELVRRDIPYVKYGGLKFLESSHVKDVLSVLRWGENPKNRVAGFRVLKLIPGIGPVIAARVLDGLAAGSYNFGVLGRMGDKGRVGNELPTLPGQRTANGEGGLWNELVGLMCMLSDSDRAWHGQMEQVRKWYQPILELNYSDHFVRNGDIEQLEIIGGQYENRQQFLAELTLDPPVMSGDLAGAPHLDDDFLILSTIHSAKGQEWKNVFILNVNDGNFPNEFACGDAGRIEEERRLLYVAMTRAKESLSLIRPLKYWVPEQARHGDKHVYGAKSRFLTPKVMEHLQTSSFGEIHTNKPAGADCGKAIMDVRKRAVSMF